MFISRSSQQPSADAGCVKSLHATGEWPVWPDEAALPATFLAVAATDSSGGDVCRRTMEACASGGHRSTAWAHRIEVAWVCEVWLQVALALVLAPGVVAAWMLGVRASLLWRVWWVVAHMHEHEEDAFGAMRGGQQQLSEVGGQVRSRANSNTRAHACCNCVMRTQAHACQRMHAFHSRMEQHHLCAEVLLVCRSRPKSRTAGRHLGLSRWCQPVLGHRVRSDRTNVVFSI